jgi:hypothetical protein
VIKNNKVVEQVECLALESNKSFSGRPTENGTTFSICCKSLSGVRLSIACCVNGVVVERTCVNVGEFAAASCKRRSHRSFVRSFVHDFLAARLGDPRNSLVLLETVRSNKIYHFSHSAVVPGIVILIEANKKGAFVRSNVTRLLSAQIYRLRLRFSGTQS